MKTIPLHPRKLFLSAIFLFVIHAITTGNPRPIRVGEVVSPAHTVYELALLPASPTPNFFCLRDPLTGNCVPDSLLALNGDTISFSACPFDGINWAYQWFLNDLPIPGETGPTINATQHIGSGKLACQLYHPILSSENLETAAVRVKFDPGVRCGDANANGMVDVLDLIPLGLVGTSPLQLGPKRNQILTSGMDTQPYPAWPWDNYYGLPPAHPNPKHSDTNGDGCITLADLGCIESQAEPLQLPLSHSSPIFGEIGTFRNEEIQLDMFPQIQDLIRTPDGDLQMRVVVKIGTLPANRPFVKVRGIVFSGPFTESEHYSIKSVEMDLTGSELVPNPASALHITKMHKDIAIQSPLGSRCEGNRSFQVDTGIMNPDGAVVLRAGAKVGVCIVTLEDVYKTMGGPGASGVPSTLPLLISKYNVLFYSESSSGEVEIFGNACRLDTMWLDLSRVYPNGSALSRKAENAALQVKSVRVRTFPSPISSGKGFQIEVALPSSGNIQAELFSLEGRRIWTTDLQGVPGKNVFSVPSTACLDGPLYLRIHHKSFSIHKTIMIHHL